jgi:ABC-type transport system substrate-binding protein
MDRSQWLEKAGEGLGWIGELVHPQVYPDVQRLGVGSTYEELGRSNLAFQKDKTAAREKARQLLAQAGYSDLSGFRVRVVTQTPTGANLRANQLLTAQLKEMGFDAVLEVTERWASARMLAKGEFGAVVYSTAAGYPNILPMLNRVVWSNGVRNFSGLKDETLDGLLADLNRSLTPVDQKRILTELDRRLQEGQHATHLMYHAGTMIIEWDYVRGHRYLTGSQEEKNDRVWLAPEAPGRS